ncbi:uncharacterized protein SPAPADRAFT_61121 [Spathaspora passalidarum NRRL Y-27907]|uniref:RNA polymerase II-associated protein RBA50 n=1 Tax=Spathaspora passalidarum (strain NRRL Y-27907 / 11-Y1) TaxID=619300 RepID=G3ANT4_SPAPN|nr:uncharacterized protein SPAPADRAFT_61121 [Spathaspora passalidarum NRRL Y-27907]EGW32019.1 hypothetical protein SPAPADRAFT_61121 [Spathaspora passalidarum NRRL Y-27907]
MDFLGEIVEHETETPQAPVPVSTGGFPELGKLKQKKVSRWKQRLDKTKSEPPADQVQEQTQPEVQVLSEAEKIHRENLETMSKMTQQEILAEQQELLEGLDPKLVQSLLSRTKKRSDHDHDHKHEHRHEHAEGYNGWIGAVRTPQGLSDLSQLDKEDVDKALGISHDLPIEDIKERDPSKKSVSFDQTVKTVRYEDLDESVELDPNGWEDVTDINELIPDEIAPEEYQINPEEPQVSVHFPKPKSDDLDINDPDFDTKLHEKYYPDLPIETEKLSWMKPAPETVVTTYESISDMRFDFKGDIVELRDSDDKQDIPTYMGLHHHSENPNLAGYTLSELAHLSRSVLPGQRCIAIQTLGRILYKLGSHHYSIAKTDNEQFDEQVQEMANNFESMIWDLIEELRIVDSVTEASDESKTRNLSVRNYAIEALWLWKKGGGRPKAALKTEEDVVAEALR